MIAEFAAPHARAARGEGEGKSYLPRHAELGKRSFALIVH